MTDAVPPDQIRVSDADRKVVQERLHLAHADGLITLEEFDSRVAATWTAKTRGDLAVVTADLPPPEAPKSALVPLVAPLPVRRRPGATALRVLATIWLSISVVNLVVWGLVCITTGQFIYPWWVWVATPSGAVLGVVWWMVLGGRQGGSGPAVER